MTTPADLPASRRSLLAALGLTAVGLSAATTSGCGALGGIGGAGAVDLVRADAARQAVPDASAAQAAAAPISAFTAELYGRLAAQAGSGNLVCSPYSAYVALAMTAQGARGATLQEILAALHVPNALDLAAAANAVDQALSRRAGTTTDEQGNGTSIELAGANSLWGQKDLAWQQPFLDTLAADFGTGMYQVDYRTAAGTARRQINSWVADRTGGRITELVPDGALDDFTRLVMVNAIYLKAPWAAPFDVASTHPTPFTRLDGTTVEADLMRGSVSGGYATGPGWVAADLPYGRRALAMAVVVPDRGRFAQVEKGMDGAWLAQLLSGFTPGEGDVGLPRWTTRSPLDLAAALEALGIRTAFTTAADLSGLTTQEALMVGAALQQGFIAVDESGTEAAAATAVIEVATSAQVDPPTVVADRPFLYVIHDIATRVPLFIGRVLDPTT